MERSSLWSISWLRHQMFYPYIMFSAASAFQWLMQCLRGLVAGSLLVYLDDNIIDSPDFYYHMQHLDEVFQRLWQHGPELQLAKCKLLQPEVNSLGHVVDQNGV